MNMGLAEAFGSPSMNMGSMGLAEAFGSPPIQNLPAPARPVPEGNPLQPMPMPVTPPEPTTGPRLNPLQTMEFRDTNGNKIEDREEGIYLSRDYLPETMSGLGAYYNQLSGPTTLEEAFAQPPTTPTTLEEAFAQPIQSSVTIEQSVSPTIEIGGATVTLPESHFQLSEEEQSKAIENISEYIKQKQAENTKTQEQITQMRETLDSSLTPEETVEEYGKDVVGGFPGFFPGAMGGAKFMSAIAPHPLLKPGLALAGGIGGGLMGSAVTGPYVRAVTDPLVDGAKDFYQNKTVFGKQGLMSLGDDFNQGVGAGMPSIIDNSMVPYETYDSSSTGVIPPTPLVP